MVDQGGSFSGRLRDLMRENGWNQKRVAGIAGVTEQTVSRWFRLGILPTDGTNYKIAIAGKVQPKWLATGLSPREISTGTIMPPLQVVTPAEQPGHNLIKENTLVAQSELNVAEGMTITRKVLESGTGYANALWHNLKSFEAAVDKEEKVKELEQKMDRMLEEMAELRKAVTMQQDGVPEKKQDAN